MFRNYLKIAWRNIVKNSFHSLVNIIGLSVGVAFTIIISGYAWSEWQVNAELKNSNNQYIIQSKWKDAAQGNALTCLGPLSKWLKEKYPTLVANYYRWDGITSNVSHGDKVFREGIQIGDSTLLNMYGFSLLQGNATTALNAPFTAVITDEKAIKFFGRTDAVGQTLTIQNFSGDKHDFIVTGVMQKPYKNSVTYVNDENNNQIYISDDNLAYFGRNMDWNNQFIINYIELQPGINPESLVQPMKDLIRNNAPHQFAQDLTPYLVSLNDYHLNANNGLVKKMLLALSAIALFILLMAIINFINMSVSRSATRMREIGIRKVLGGMRNQLIIQFLVESMVLVLFATMLGLAIYEATRSLFDFILGSSLPSLKSFPIYFITYPLLLVLFIGFLAGIYPAFVLSSLRSVESLKGKLTAVKENVALRKSLVGFQFGTATIVFIGALVIAQQVNLFFGKDLGYDKDYVVSAQLPRDWTPQGVQRMETIRKQFAAMPEVSSVSLSYEVPDGNNAGPTYMWKQGADSATGIVSQILFSDEYFTNTYNIPMAAGVFFGQPGAVSDTFGVVINETQAKMFGWKDPQEAIGKQMVYATGAPTATIKGVIKDFNFGSMQRTIAPITFVHVGAAPTYRYFSFKLKQGDVAQSLAALERKWSELMPGSAFDYRFMDDRLKALYKSEIQLKQAAYAATVLALVIVLLGVLGLVSLSIQKRKKEIGIRKVLGSSVPEIVSLFMKEFLIIVLFAGLVACPLAYWIMTKWLEGYAHRIAITGQPFLFSVSLLALITSLLIGMQTVKAANTNPVDSLRTE